MNAFLIDEKLITDKNDIRDIWANRFEDLGKPSVRKGSLIMTFLTELHRVKASFPVP